MITFGSIPFKSRGWFGFGFVASPNSFSSRHRLRSTKGHTRGISGGCGCTMSNAAVSRKTPANRKGNKENAEPADGVKSLTGRNLSRSASSVSVKFKSNKKQVTLRRNGASEIEGPKSKLSAVAKPSKSAQKDANNGGQVKRQARNRAVLTEHTVKNAKVVTGAPRAPGAAALSKVVPGMYKGKIVESKIGSIWKSSATAAPKPENQKFGNLTKSRSKSVSDVPRRVLQKPVPPRSKSAFDGRAQASKPATSGSVPGTLRNATVAVAKPKVAQTDQKAKKPPVTSTLSQYRSTETTQERREKLAEWMSSKGKTLKRPAMTSARTQTKTRAPVNPKTRVAAPQHAAEAERRLDLAASAPYPEGRQAFDAVRLQTPVILNTSFNLPENQDLDLPVVQDGFENIVLNLCEVLEAMQTPSKCQDELPQSTNNVVGEEEDGATEDVPKDDDAKEMLTDEKESEKKMLRGQCNDANMEDAPQMENAYIVKYSVKTTPHLQSVKRTMAGDVQTSASRRKSNIRDLKFLTPVRRSRRIERQSLRLPPAVLDHDPCVSSLAELAKLDDDLTAYVYRKNCALAGDDDDDDLTDQVEA
ncbi:uncharacterized protein LOC144006759 [Festucalex cinctus]